MLAVNSNINTESKILINSELQKINTIAASANFEKSFGAYLKKIITIPDTEFEKLKPNHFIAPDGQPIDQEQDWLGCEVPD
jgi:hypothetical protein